VRTILASLISWAFAISPGFTAETGGTPLELDLVTFATGLSDLIGIKSAGDDRLFALDRTGVIRIIRSNGSVESTPFLSITARVDSSSSEEGLLGIAFHPQYATNGFFYLQYTNTTSAVRRTRLSRFSVSDANPDVGDPNSEEVLLTVTQPSSNHNAGKINFGLDGYLYMPLGDGGGSGDTSNNAQTLSVLLGKVVRIDVDSGAGTSPDCVGLGTGNYTVPNSNPLTNGPGGTCDEIWAIGLRNPWQSSFDRATGDLWISDVGQDAVEEVDMQPAGSGGGENFGWRCYEGNNTFNTSGCGPMGDYTFPVFAYNQSPGGHCSVVGGYVYRGSAFPNMQGRYLLTDYCSGRFWDLAPNGMGGYVPTSHTNLQAFGYTSFGEGADGELYLAQQSGTVYRIVDLSTPPPLDFVDGFE
jgi:glucose/arabinose dehydrogenase